MGKLMQEFRDFAVKGNMLDMAVGMIIGAAFKDIVNSVVNDLVMPVVGLFTGKIDFSNMFIALDGNEYATLAAAQEVAAPTFNYGLFITEVINFVILAFVIFMMVKWVNKVRTSVEPKKEEVPAAPTEKTCPFCQSTISIKATRCPHCTSELTE
ncbi:MAG: large conductance mechanosensitive channel protein MscL [Lachnospiraceae bacterium]|nr:large conductance mechanosensitive channel protein MscL [Lachnospiraceae bacterium]